MKSLIVLFSVFSMFVLGTILGSEKSISIDPKSYPMQGNIRDGYYYAPNHLFSVQIPKMIDKILIEEDYPEDISFYTVIFSDEYGNLVRLEVLSPDITARENINKIYKNVYHSEVENRIKKYAKKAKTILEKSIPEGYFAIMDIPSGSTLSDANNKRMDTIRGFLISSVGNQIVIIHYQDDGFSSYVREQLEKNLFAMMDAKDFPLNLEQRKKNIYKQLLNVLNTYKNEVQFKNLQGKIYMTQYYAPQNTFVCDTTVFGAICTSSQDLMNDNFTTAAFYTLDGSFNKVEAINIPNNMKIVRDGLKRAFDEIVIGVLKDTDEAEGINVLKEEFLNFDNHEALFIATSIKSTNFTRSRETPRELTRSHLIYALKDRLMILSNQLVADPIAPKHSEEIPKLKDEILRFAKSFQ